MIPFKTKLIQGMLLLASLLFPVAIFLVRSQPISVIVLCILWLSTLFPLFNNSRRTFHQITRNRAIKVQIRIREIQKQEQGDARVISYLRKINPFVFEELILLALENHGFSTIPNKRYTGDGGIDGRVKVYGKIWPIQAKRYSKHVKKSHIEEFSRLIKDKRYSGGLFVHTGRTGKEIRDAYRKGTLIILSGSILVDFLCFPQNLTIAHLLSFRNVNPT